MIALMVILALNASILVYSCNINRKQCSGHLGFYALVLTFVSYILSDDKSYSYPYGCIVAPVRVVSTLMFQKMLNDDKNMMGLTTVSQNCTFILHLAQDCIFILDLHCDNDSVSSSLHSAGFMLWGVLLLHCPHFIMTDQVFDPRFLSSAICSTHFRD